MLINNRFLLLVFLLVFLYILGFIVIVGVFLFVLFFYFVLLDCYPTDIGVEPVKRSLAFKLKVLAVNDLEDREANQL